MKLFFSVTWFSRKVKISKVRKTIINRAVLLFAALCLVVSAAVGQDSARSSFKIGERLTYNVSFERYNNVAYAETYVASRGKIDGKDAVELHSRIKTLGFVSAAFYLLDESRTVFASPVTGMPMYVETTSNGGLLPKQNISNNLASPAASFDLLTLIYQMRSVGGVGTFAFSENGKTYSVALQSSGAEKVKTDAGEFDTTVSTATSDYFTELGIKDLKINFVNDDRHTPAVFRFATAKGNFRAVLASSTITEPQVAEADLAQTPVPIPQPIITPRPSPTPVPYVDNEPLSEELPFALGETLDYKITISGSPSGSARLQAKERTQFQGIDSLLLTAEITGVNRGNTGLCTMTQCQPALIPNRSRRSKPTSSSADLSVHLRIRNATICLAV
jgi:Protein of unknown function (DUF3108).